MAAGSARRAPKMKVYSDVSSSSLSKKAFTLDRIRLEPVSKKLVRISLVFTPDLVDPVRIGADI